MKQLIGSAAATLLGIMTAASAQVDQPGADWISADQAKSKLMAAGYSSITKLKPMMAIGRGSPPSAGLLSQTASQRWLEWRAV